MVESLVSIFHKTLVKATLIYSFAISLLLGLEAHSHSRLARFIYAGNSTVSLEITSSVRPRPVKDVNIPRISARPSVGGRR